MSKTLFRIEYKDGWGPFRSIDAFYEESKWSQLHEESFEDYAYSVPSPNEESLKRSDNHFCAFNNIRDLVTHVPRKVRKDFRQRGYKFLKIEVSKCRTSETQSVYKKKHVISEIEF